MHRHGDLGDQIAASTGDEQGLEGVTEVVMGEVGREGA
jgi:hypothetical protein